MIGLTWYKTNVLVILNQSRDIGRLLSKRIRFLLLSLIFYSPRLRNRLSIASSHFDNSSKSQEIFQEETFISLTLYTKQQDDQWASWNGPCLVYVSIASLKIKGILQYARFWYYVVPVVSQAQSSAMNGMHYHDGLE